MEKPVPTDHGRDRRAAAPGTVPAGVGQEHLGPRGPSRARSPPRTSEEGLFQSLRPTRVVRSELRKIERGTVGGGRRGARISRALDEVHRAIEELRRVSRCCRKERTEAQDRGDQPWPAGRLANDCPLRAARAGRRFRHESTFASGRYLFIVAVRGSKPRPGRTMSSYNS